MKRSRNIFLIGPMGAGKSTIGRQLADILKMDFYDTDRVIEERCGASIDWIFDLEGEDGLREREEKVIHELTELTGIVIATGGGAVCSEVNRNRLAARGIVIYLQATIDQQHSRTIRDKSRPLLQVDNKMEQLQKLAGEREPLYSEIADFTIETDHGSIRNVANAIISHVEEHDLI